MNKGYFVVELAQSVQGQAKRISISHKFLAAFLVTLTLFSVIALGLFSSYLRMSWKVSHYNQLRADFDQLRTRYQELQRISRQHNEQMASLETLASEVSVAYGLNPPASTAEPGEPLDADTSAAPNFKESIDQFNYLRAATYGGIYHHYAYRWLSHTEPSLWPVDGALRSAFGTRADPLNGEGAFHTGVDLQASVGTPVHVSADGVVASAGWSGRYGKLVVVHHGNGLETYYAHLSRFMVIPGQEVGRGQVIALSGGTGRVTGPHLHYEVRLAGTPVNPYKFMKRTQIVAGGKTVHNDLGL